MTTWIVTAIMLGVVALAPGTAAAGKSIGRTFGEVGRAIVDDSRSAYEHSRDFVVDAGHSVSQDAREAYEDAKHIGPQMVEDVKDGFNGNGQVPDPATAAPPAMEKP
jgi:hypothetical protein